eukprot:2923086-Prymnesium_polylepis.2
MKGLEEEVAEAEADLTEARAYRQRVMKTAALDALIAHIKRRQAQPRAATKMYRISCSVHALVAFAVASCCLNSRLGAWVCVSCACDPVKNSPCPSYLAFGGPENPKIILGAAQQWWAAPSGAATRRTPHTSVGQTLKKAVLSPEVHADQPTPDHSLDLYAT